MPKKLLIILLIVVIGGGVLLGFLWWQRGEKRKIEEQTEPESTIKVMISSSLNSNDVIENIMRLPHDSEWFNREEFPSFLVEFWEEDFGISSSGKGFVECAIVPWIRDYIKRDGTEMSDVSESKPFILFLYVIKYEEPKFAQEDYSKVNTNHGFDVSTLGGVKLKIKSGIPSSFGGLFLLTDVKLDKYQQFLFQSDNFIIYAVGLKEAAEDVMIRVIDQYTAR